MPGERIDENIKNIMMPGEHIKHLNLKAISKRN